MQERIDPPPGDGDEPRAATGRDRKELRRGQRESVATWPAAAAGDTELVCWWPNSTRTVGRTRQALATTLDAWDMPALRDPAVLVLSELVTNSVLHAREPWDRLVETRFVRLPGGVRIEVHDANKDYPAMQRVGEDAEAGRGLALVDALTNRRWGVSSRAGVGKSVWAVLGSDGPGGRAQSGGPVVGVVSAGGPTAGSAGSVRHGRITHLKETVISSQQSPAVIPENPDPGKQPAPWSTPGTWTITTDSGLVTSGYLPEWAEDDPTETGVPLDLLPARLSDINHRTFFEGATMPLTSPDAKGGVEEDAVFEGSIDCNPYDPDARLRVPLVNIQVSLGHLILGLDPAQLADVAEKLRAQADRLYDEILPALIAAREDWANRPVG